MDAEEGSAGFSQFFKRKRTVKILLLLTVFVLLFIGSLLITSYTVPRSTDPLQTTPSTSKTNDQLEYLKDAPDPFPDIVTPKPLILSFVNIIFTVPTLVIALYALCLFAAFLIAMRKLEHLNDGIFFVENQLLAEGGEGERKRISWTSILILSSLALLAIISGSLTGMALRAEHVYENRPRAASPNLDSLYKPIKDLGSGAFGKVYLAREIYGEHRLVAVKVVLLSEDDFDAGLEKSNASKQTTKLLLRNEASVLKLAHHENIIQFIDYLPREGYELKGDDALEAMVTEYFGGIPLLKLRSPDVAVMKQIIRQLFSALDYLHTKLNYKHGDIKSENILYTISDNTRVNIKLIDFGFARPVTDLLQNTGTVSHMAPEVLSSTGSLDAKADVWSACVTVVSMYNSPYRNLITEDQINGVIQEFREKADKLSDNLAKKPNDKRLERKLRKLEKLLKDEKETRREAISVLTERMIKANTVPEMRKVPDELKPLLIECLIPDPKKRPSADHFIDYDYARSSS